MSVSLMMLLTGCSTHSTTRDARLTEDIKKPPKLVKPISARDMAIYIIKQDNYVDEGNSRMRAIRSD